MDFSQPNFIQFRDITAEKTSPLVLWIGAGLSAPAKLPLWAELKDRLIEEGKAEANQLDSFARRQMQDQLQAAQTHSALWKSFSMIKEALGKAGYESKIRNIFSKVDKVSIPENYELLMRLNPRGIITTNIDRFSSRSYVKNIGNNVTEFSGRQCSEFLHVHRGAKSFILNLHGIHNDATSWVFTQEELNELQNLSGYINFLNSCFCSDTILFIGTKIEDISIATHLEKINKSGCENHFLLTSDNSHETRSFCGENKILPIYYSAKNNHEELKGIITSLITYKPLEIIEDPIIKYVDHSLDNIEIDEKFTSHPLNIQRRVLNHQASLLLAKASSKGTYEEYRDFREKYQRFIHNAWFVQLKEPNNELLDYVLIKSIGQGAFGHVYEARDKEGKSVAVKLLKIDVMQDEDRLQAFRRGVSSMKILSDSKINGMVPYIDSSEIPAFVVMNYIVGVNLKEAVEAKKTESWEIRLRILTSIAQIMKNAHHLPERVLHRDLRPQNIMLDGFDYVSDEWDVVLLDFDLAWYKDAHDVSVDHSGSINGFLAPELVANDVGRTRNAMVDSFGLGMLIYYITTKKEPFFNQHASGYWSREVLGYFKKNLCKEWFSLPMILARTVIRTTSSNQGERLDMSQILGVFNDLNTALWETRNLRSSSRIAEELCCRILYIINKTFDYCWNEDKSEANFEHTNGGSLFVAGNESLHEISIKIEWTNKGMYNFNTVKRKLSGAHDGMVSTFKKHGLGKINSSMRTDQLSILGTIHKREVLNNLDDIANGMATLFSKTLCF